MRRTLEKMASLVFSFLLFSWMANPVHEKFHMLTANALGVEGYVTFYWWMDYFNYVGPVDEGKRVIIGLSGGLLTGLLFGLAWYITHRQLRYTRWELDDTAALGMVAITHIVYSFFDGFWKAQAYNGAGLGAIVAMVVALAIYGKPIIKWLEEE